MPTLRELNPLWPGPLVNEMPILREPNALWPGVFIIHTDEKIPLPPLKKHSPLCNLGPSGRYQVLWPACLVNHEQGFKKSNEGLHENLGPANTARRARENIQLCITHKSWMNAKLFENDRWSIQMYMINSVVDILSISCNIYIWNVKIT